MRQKEIARRYLLSALPQGYASAVYAGAPIKQGYFLIGDPELRLRDLAGRFYLGEIAGVGIEREREESEIDEVAFRLLWPLTKEYRVAKTRYRLPLSGEQTWDLNVFTGAHEGLILAEVGLAACKQLVVIPPAINKVIVADVTDDVRYLGKNLAFTGKIPTR